MFLGIKMFGIITILITVICSHFPTSEAKMPKISTSRGAYFQNIEHMHVYEHTTPIIYYFKLPDIQSVRHIQDVLVKIEKCNGNQEKCIEIKSDLEDILEMIKEMNEVQKAIIHEFEPTLKRRVKRGWQLLGDFDHWCCNVLTDRQGQEFKDNEMTLKEGYSRLSSSVIKDHAALLNISTETQVFNNKITEKMNDLRLAINEVSKYFENETELDAKKDAAFRVAQMYLSNAFVQNSKMQYLFSACKSHYLPMAIVKEPTLISDLRKVQKKASSSNMEIALDPVKDLKYYHHSKLINCYIHEDEVEIEVKIPLKTKGSDYSVFEFHPLHFKSHSNQICHWDQEPMLLIHNEKSNAVMVITGNDLESCNKKNDLCFITQNRACSSQSECAKALFLQKDHEDILKTCVFKCDINHQNAVVKQIDHEVFAITNARNPLQIKDIVTNNSTNATIEESWPGTLIIRVPCSNEISHIRDDNSTEVLVSTGLPCARLVTQINIEHHLPIIWTHYKFLETDPGIHQSVRFPNLSVIYDKDWPLKIPHFIPITSNKDFAENLKNLSEIQKENHWYEATYYTIVENPSNSIMGLWLTILTAIVLNMWIRQCYRQTIRTLNSAMLDATL